jgi:MFS family permease
MGIWNSHTSVGNILGSLIAGYWVSSNWGLSFIVPGLVIAAMGVVCFLFLIEREYCSVTGCRKIGKDFLLVDLREVSVHDFCHGKTFAC